MAGSMGVYILHHATLNFLNINYITSIKSQSGCYFKVSRQSPSISHLLFADDLVVFAKSKCQGSLFYPLMSQQVFSLVQPKGEFWLVCSVPFSLARTPNQLPKQKSPPSLASSLSLPKPNTWDSLIHPKKKEQKNPGA